MPTSSAEMTEASLAVASTVLHLIILWPRVVVVGVEGGAGRSCRPACRSGVGGLGGPRVVGSVWAQGSSMGSVEGGTGGALGARWARGGVPVGVVAWLRVVLLRIKVKHAAEAA